MLDQNVKFSVLESLSRALGSMLRILFYSSGVLFQPDIYANRIDDFYG